MVDRLKSIYNHIKRLLSSETVLSFENLSTDDEKEEETLNCFVKTNANN